MSDETKALVRRYNDELIRGDPSAFVAHLADDFVDHEMIPGIPATRAGVQMLFEQLRSAFSGFHMHVESMVTEGDLVAVRVMMTGKHVGGIMGIPLTGKDVQIPVCHWIRVRDGEGVEHWRVTGTSAPLA